MKWTCRKFQGDFIIRSRNQTQDIARVYGSKENAAKIQCVPELIANTRQLHGLLESLSRAYSLDEKLKVVNSKKIKELLKESGKILKRCV